MPEYCPSQAEFVAAIRSDVVMQVSAFAIFFALVALAVFAIRLVGKRGGWEQESVIGVVAVIGLLGALGFVLFLLFVPGYFRGYYFPRAELHRADTPDCMEDRVYARLQQQIEELEEDKKAAKIQADKDEAVAADALFRCRDRGY